MNDRIPREYLERMRRRLGGEYLSFVAEYDREPVRALRFNRNKARPETVEKLKAEWKLEPVPWCRDAFYYEESGDVRPGLSPYHEAGVFYIQEPSAMIPAEMAGIDEGDIVLDICAAPGGKSSQTAEKCRFLVSSDPVFKRAGVLSSNIERMGYRNCLVCSAFPDKLSECFKEFFDKILADAPCSGEGMMRKDGTAVSEWSARNVERCVKRQAEILNSAAGMLKAGGKLIYSTCTFEYAENEGQIDNFLLRHPDFELLNMETFYPHRVRGEGHFCAVLRKRGASQSTRANYGLSGIRTVLDKAGVPVLRCGVEKGEFINDKRKGELYVPSHAEAMSGEYGVYAENRKENVCNLKTEELARRYLSGEVLDLSSVQGGDYELYNNSAWVAVMFDAYPLGLGKVVGDRVKNHYPKGLRKAAWQKAGADG